MSPCSINNKICIGHGQQFRVTHDDKFRAHDVENALFKDAQQIRIRQQAKLRVDNKEKHLAQDYENFLIGVRIYRATAKQTHALSSTEIQLATATCGTLL